MASGIRVAASHIFVALADRVFITKGIPNDDLDTAKARGLYVIAFVERGVPYPEGAFGPGAKIIEWNYTESQEEFEKVLGEALDEWLAAKGGP
jgi:hypothetical protein